MVLFMPFGVRVFARPMRYCSLARRTLSRLKVIDGMFWATEVFCNTRFVYFFIDNVSSVFVKSVFQSSACLSDVLAVLVSVS